MRKKRKEGGSGMISAVHVAKGEEIILGHYVLDSKEIFLSGVFVAGAIETEATVITKEFKKQRTEKSK